MEDKLMTVKEVAGFLQVTERTVLNYIHANKIAAIKVGKDWRISQRLLHEWIENELTRSRQCS